MLSVDPQHATDPLIIAFVAAGAGAFGAILSQFGPWRERRLKRATRWDKERLEAYTELLIAAHVYTTHVFQVLDAMGKGVSPEEALTMGTPGSYAPRLDVLKRMAGTVEILGPQEAYNAFDKLLTSIERATSRELHDEQRAWIAKPVDARPAVSPMKEWSIDYAARYTWARYTFAHALGVKYPRLRWLLREVRARMRDESAPAKPAPAKGK